MGWKIFVCGVTILNTKSSHLSTISDALWAMHHHVDIGVGPSTTDVSCHNLDVVHNTWRVQLHTLCQWVITVHCNCTPTGAERGTTPAMNPGFMIAECGSRSNIWLTASLFLIHERHKLREIWRSGVTFTCGLTSSYQKVPLDLPIILVNSKPAINWKFIHHFVPQII